VKVVHVTLRFDAPGGVETNVHEVTKRLKAAGEEVEVFAGDLYDEAGWVPHASPRPVVDGVPVRRFPVVKRLVPGLTLPLMVGLVDALAESEADIVHAHSHRYGHVLQAAAVAERLDRPLIVSTHYHPADRREPPVKRGLLRLQDVGFGMTAYRIARALVVESELEGRLVRQFAPSGKIVVVPPGIDLAEWNDTGQPVPAALGLPDRYILFVGRVAPNKGLEHLVAALARMPAATRPHLVLMGRDWGERAALERLARNLGVDPSVMFLGHVPDRADYRAVIRHALALVLPSEWEAYGLVLLDAMAARTPIVATAVGGIPEVLDFGRLGRLVPYGEPAALAEAIGKAVDDRAERDEMVRRAGEAVAQRDWSASAERLRALYRDVTAAA
jgi:glycosyltransferase involved in cell wall biosynthesis